MPSLPVRRLFLALSLFLFTRGTTQDYGAKITDNKAELDRIRKKLDESRAEISRLEHRETNLVTRLKKLDNNLTLVNNFIEKLSEAESDLQTGIDSIKVDLDSTVKSLEERKAYLKRRVRNIYTKGRYDDFDIIFGSRSFMDFVRRNSFFRRIAENDRRLIDAIFKEQTRIEAQKLELEHRLVEVQDIKAEKNTEQKKYRKQKRQRGRVLRKVKSEKKTYLSLVEDLEKRQAAVNRIIKALETARVRSLEAERLKGLDRFGDFTALKGGLPWPARGSVIRKFGINVHPKYKTKTVNNGIDIRVREGDPITAVASGEVAYLGQMSGLGNFVVLGHGKGYYTLYGNLASVLVKKGARIALGDKVGTGGDTGSFEGTKLHFEVRRKHDILDPAQWLAK
jgi:septal ring factor EnvC (AmiA/AmiB activator)